MQCPECNSTHIRKNGQRRGKQNHICVDCDRQFIEGYETNKGYSDDVKRECLKMYVNGMGFRGIERVKGVHGWSVYPQFIPEGDQIINKTYMTRVEGENTRLRHYLARLHRKTLCYSKSVEMLQYSIQLLIHYLKFWDVPVPQKFIP